MKNSTKQINPYVIGRPIYKPELFFGRKSLFQFVEDNLIQESQVILLHGQRRIGKSSVIAQIPNFVGEGQFAFVSFYLQDKNALSLGKMLHLLAEEIIESLELSPDKIKLPSVAELENKTEIFSEEFLPLLERELEAKSLVLLLDEFDVLSNYNPNSAEEHFFPYLQSLIIEHPRLFIIPVVGRRVEDMPRLLSLFKSAPQREIALLDSRSARELIIKPAAGVLEYEDEAIAAIIELSAGHPYFTQVICFALFGEAKLDDRWVASRADVEKIADKAIEIAEGGLQWFRDGLPVAERVAFSAVAEAQQMAAARGDGVGGEPISLLKEYGVVETEALAEAGERLVKWGFLELAGSMLPQQRFPKYKVIVELVRRWLVRRYPPRDEIWQLEKAIAEANDIYKSGADLAQKKVYLKNAIALYEQALEINPNHLQGLFELGEGYLEVKDFQHGAAVYKRLYKINPIRGRDGLVESLLGYGSKLKKEGEAELAKEQFRRVLEIEPDNQKAKQGEIATVRVLRDRERKEGMRKWGSYGLVAVTLLAVATAGWQSWRAVAAERNARNAEDIETEELLLDRSLKRQLKVLALGKELQPGWVNLENRTRGALLLQKTFDFQQWRERNTLEGHQAPVFHVSFSPDGNLIASASRDNTVRLWKPDGTAVATLEGHQDSVNHVSFSPDGNLIASASRDNTVRLWKPDGTAVATLEGHQDSVNHVSFSPDGNLIASASGDNTVRLWKPDGTAVATLEGHQVWVSHVSFSPDGNLIASASWDKTVRLWKPDGTAVATLEGHQVWVSHVSFSPDGNLIASASWDKTVRLWKPDGTAVATLEGHQDWVSHVSFSPDGNLIASASGDKTVRLWKPDGTAVATLEGHQDWVSHVSFSPDGNLIASASRDNTVRLWKPDGTAVATLEGHQVWVSHVSFSPDGNLIASASGDNTVRLWKPDGTAVATLEGHQVWVSHVSFSPDGNLIASASGDKTVRLWKPDGTAVATLEGHQVWVSHVSFSPDGNLIASASWDKTVRLWKPDGTAVATLEGHQDWVSHVSFSPDGNLIASASGDNTVRLWKPDGTAVATLEGHQDSVNHVSFSPDGNLIASASGDNTVRLWKPDGTAVATLEGHQVWVSHVSFSPDGNLIASASWDKTVRLWKPDGTAVATLEGHQVWVSHVSFSPDGNLIASASWDKTVRLWKPDGTAVATLEGHQDWVSHVSFSPDGNLIASASGDKTVRLWKPDGTAVATLEGHQDWVSHVSFSPDGNLIASASRDNTVRLWNLNLDYLLAQGCDWVAEYLNTLPEGDQNKRLCESINN